MNLNQNRVQNMEQQQVCEKRTVIGGGEGERERVEKLRKEIGK
jgi:hypothetical protein